MIGQTITFKPSGEISTCRYCKRDIEKSMTVVSSRNGSYHFTPMYRHVAGNARCWVDPTIDDMATPMSSEDKIDELLKKYS